MSLASERSEKTLVEMKRWVADPFNESFMFERALKKLREFSSGQEVNIGEVLTSLTSLSTWYASKGIVEIVAGNTTTEGLCNSFWCDLFYNTIMKSSFEKAKSQKKGSLLGAFSALKNPKQPKPRITFNEQGLLLAKAFALGLVAEGEAIGRDSLIGLKDGRFYGLDQNQLTPFVLSVFAKWKNVALLPADFPFMIPDGYQELLQKLMDGPDEIRPAIVKACDFHVSRSKAHTDQDTYEFADPVYAIYPVEILFVFRIRQLLGLSNPKVDHPLLNSPLGKLPNTECSLSPSLIPILERIKKDFPANNR